MCWNIRWVYMLVFLNQAEPVLHMGKHSLILGGPYLVHMWFWVDWLPFGPEKWNSSVDEFSLSSGKFNKQPSHFSWPIEIYYEILLRITLRYFLWQRNINFFSSLHAVLSKASNPITFTWIWNNQGIISE